MSALGVKRTLEDITASAALIGGNPSAEPESIAISHPLSPLISRQDKNPNRVRARSSAQLAIYLAGHPHFTCHR